MLPYGYPIVKTLALAVMLASQIVIALTVAIAQANGGWVVVTVNKYSEGLIEAAILSALTPMAAYVTIKEVMNEARKMRKSNQWKAIRRNLMTALTMLLSPIILIMLIILFIMMWIDERRHGYSDYEPL